ncbi:MAG: LuxR C-terminal-related transcriptional regulator [Anaerolineae bacterium]|nr:LuxR C-terminal-related transcriptional regulator [Anaerolineae bacterium]
MQQIVSQKWQESYDGLSKRAVEILRLLDEGLSDREIADRLVMTINTVKWYNRQIYSSLGVGSRTQAIARARELHLLDEDSESTPPIELVSHTSRHNLPVETTHFIGRENELNVIKHLLNTVHLLTLVGPPGTGKTRLGLQTAWDLVDTFRDGVYFISLAPITDPDMVTNNIAGCIGVKAVPDEPIIETTKRFLRERHMLLVLDNFEHLLAAAPQIGELLAAAPDLKVLATSREPLHLYGEQEYAVPPLALPDMEHLSPEALLTCESVALFMQQARAVRADFELTSENAHDVAQICIRLEGLPLAIELAAARSKLLTPSALLARLNSRLDTLTGGAHNLPPRQRTLRQTIGWSYELLTDEEKKLFARLAVFRGGRSLEAVEAVCEPGLNIDALEGIESLLNKSLLFQQAGRDGEPRFFMLETLHEYAGEQLEASGEAEMMRRRHAEYYVDYAEHAEPEFRQAGFSHWMSCVDAESGNMCGALEWAFSGGDVILGLRLVASLRDYWIMSSGFTDGKMWTQRALTNCQTVPPDLHVRVLTTAGMIHFYLSNRDLQKQLLQKAVQIARARTNPLNLAWALTFLGSASIGVPTEYEEGVAVTEEGLEIFRQIGHKPGMAQALNIIGEIARTYGNYERARVVYEECLRLVRETGEIRRESMILSNLGFSAMHQGDVDRAHRLFRQSFEKLLQLSYDKHLIVSNVLAQVLTIAAKGDPERAARLIGAAEASLEKMGAGLQPGRQSEYERTLSLVRSQLDPATFEACWNEGRPMSLDQMVAHALQPEES